MTYQPEQFLRDLVIAALAVRVFGPSLVTGLRRVAAAGVRTGANELQRRSPGASK